MRIKEIKVIVNENLQGIPFMEHYPWNITKSSVTIKWQKGKKQYGEYIGFTKPNLTVEEEEEAVNKLLEKVVGKRKSKKQKKQKHEDVSNPSISSFYSPELLNNAKIQWKKFEALPVMIKKENNQ